MEFYFYCPKCDYEKAHTRLPKFGAVGNIRDGWGTPINHYECPMCHNLDAGYMLEKTGDLNERKYYRSVISMYQDVRGFKNFNED